MLALALWHGHRFDQAMNKNPYPESDPLHHTLKVKRMLNPIIEHLRKDVEILTEPKAQALFETSAEVLDALVRTLDHYEQKTERAWRPPDLEEK
jgi:hypothetical protein